MVLILAAIVVAAAVGITVAWCSTRIVSELRAAREAAARGRVIEILTAFAPAGGAATKDPRAVLEWEPLARIARQLFPDEFAQIDRAAGAPFPFGPERIQAAHAQWTADWLAWEGAHDAEYKLKAAVVEEALAGAADSRALRARSDAIEREKLEIYQRRYQEYVQVAKGLQRLGS